MEDRKILIVEDERKIADTLKPGLTENGYHVEAAYDGTIGYNMFQAQVFDLIVLDINLPGKQQAYTGITAKIMLDIHA